MYIKLWILINFWDGGQGLYYANWNALGVPYKRDA